MTPVQKEYFDKKLHELIGMLKDIGGELETISLIDLMDRLDDVEKFTSHLSSDALDEFIDEVEKENVERMNKCQSYQSKYQLDNWGTDLEDPYLADRLNDLY